MAYTMTWMRAGAAAIALGCGTAWAQQQATTDEAKKEERRQAILKMRDRTLADLYKHKPEVKDEIEKAVGYAVFDSTGVYVLLVLGIYGSGVLVDNAAKKTTYMTTERIGTGPGVGYRHYRSILVFKSKDLLDTFTTVGADINAEGRFLLKTGGAGTDFGFSGSGNPWLSTYEIQDSGIAAEINWGGSAYTPDASLNAK